MDVMTALLVIGVVMGFCIVGVAMLAFVAVAFSAYQNLDEPYDDLHEEEEYLDDYQNKRQQR
jgi:hypothetical protein